MKQTDTYNLTQSINHHKNILRTITSNSQGVIVSGSFDKTCAFFTEIDGVYTHLRDTKYHDDYIYVVHSDVQDRGFFSGSKDAKVIYMDNLGNPLAEYIGHTMTVNSISQSVYDCETFISGSWDTTARIWDINTQKCLYALKDHSYAVATLALPGQRFITGSQDKNLRIWDKDKQIRVIQNAHDDIIRDIILSQDGKTFYTCSNDCLIKQWTLGGDLIETLSGHEGFIFSLFAEKGLLFSGGDDKIVKIWQDGKSTQELIHPNTVWDLTLNRKNGDLLTACADGVIRVFSDNPQRWLSQQEIDDYTNMCVYSGMKEQNQNEAVDVSKLPKFEERFLILNAKEGEIRIFNNKNNAEAYAFKNGTWELMGEVLGTKDTKKYWHGDKAFLAGEYDFIFDVELEGGVSQIPFNRGGNALVAAEKFIGREGLHKLYVDDVTKFLRKNAGMNTQPGSSNTGYHTQKNVSTKKVSPLLQIDLPILKFTVFDQLNTEGPLKKITELNSTLIGTNKALSNSQLELLKSFLNTINKTAFYHNSSFTENEIAVLFHLLLTWEKDEVIPILDTCRMFLLHPRSDDLFKKIGGGVQLFTILMENIKTGSQLNVILSMRCLANLFKNESSRIFVVERRQEILDAASVYLDHENKLVRGSFVSLMFNYSVIYSTKEDNEGVLQVLSIVNEMLNMETESEIIKQMLMTLGNLFCESQSNRSIGKDMDIVSNVKEIKNSTGSDEDIKLQKEVKEYLISILG